MTIKVIVRGKTINPNLTPYFTRILLEKNEINNSPIFKPANTNAINAATEPAAENNVVS